MMILWMRWKCYKFLKTVYNRSGGRNNFAHFILGYYERETVDSGNSKKNKQPKRKRIFK